MYGVYFVEEYTQIGKHGWFNKVQQELEKYSS